MKLLIALGLAMLIAVSCSHAVNVAGRNHGCDTTALSDVFSDPPSFFGKRFCGEVLAVPEGRVLKIFPPSSEIPAERNDVVLFFDSAATDALDPPDGRPFRVYVEGVIGGMEECFQSPPSGMASACTPYRHPINLTVSSYRRLN